MIIWSSKIEIIGIEMSVNMVIMIKSTAKKKSHNNKKQVGNKRSQVGNKEGRRLETKETKSSAEMTRSQIVKGNFCLMISAHSPTHPLTPVKLFFFHHVPL